MNKTAIAEFFDACAPTWDAEMIRHEDRIQAILNNAGIQKGTRVLDVACGTGVLFPDYVNRGAEVTAIDLSPEMAKIAAGKFPEIRVFCGDVETWEFDGPFDCVMVYNALPHFPDPENLIATLAKWVKPGGKLSVAHGMSRAALTDHHRNVGAISMDLLHQQELAAIFSRWFDVDVMISTDQMYQVCGIRREEGAHSHAGLTHSHDHSHTGPEELLALVRYMVSHNDAHAQELASLASQLEELGKPRAAGRIREAVVQFDMGNALLDGVRKELEFDIM